MAESKLMRVSGSSYDRISARAKTTSRTLIAEHDRVVEAGITALEASEAKPRPARKRPKIPA